MASKPWLRKRHRQLVEVVHVDGRDDGPLLHVGEQGNLAPLLLRQRLLRAADQDIRLDADGAQLLDRMLGGLGLDLGRRGDVGHQGQVHVDTVLGAKVRAQLPDRLEERQRLDVAHGSADLDDADVGVAGTQPDAALDLVRHVGNDLHGGAQVVPAALLRDHAAVDPARS